MHSVDVQWLVTSWQEVSGFSCWVIAFLCAVFSFSPYLSGFHSTIKKLCIVNFLSMPLTNAVAKHWCCPQRCKVAVPPYKRIGQLTDCMLYVWNKFLYLYRMKNWICALKSLGQINSCNWLDCIMPVEGDKSKYGTFLFYDCKSWQVISPISLTQCRLGISGHTSKNWNKTKKNSWLFKESVQYRQPGLSATVSQSE